MPRHLESVLPTFLHGCGFDRKTGYRSEAAFLGPSWNLATDNTHPGKKASPLLVIIHPITGQWRNCTNAGLNLKSQ